MSNSEGLNQDVARNGRPNGHAFCPSKTSMPGEMRASGAEADDAGNGREATGRNHDEFKDLFDNAPVGFLEMDAKGRLVRVNNTGLKMLGYTAEELLGQFVWTISADPETTRRNVTARLSGAMPALQGLERLFRRKDGSTFPVIINEQMVMRGDGVIIGLRAGIQDISACKMVETKLKLSRALIENSADAIHVVDPATARFLDVNASACRMLGYTRDEHLALTVFDVAVGLDRARFDESIRRAKKAGNFTVEGLHRRKDGSTHPMEVSMTPVTLDREYLVVIVRDISERKRAEESLRNSERFLRLIMDSVPHFIFVKDRDSRHLLVNRACAEAAGRTPEQMVGLSDRDMAPGSDRAETYMTDDQKVIATGQPKFIEETLVDAKGRTRILQTTKIPFPSSTVAIPVSGGEPAILGVSVDITDRKQVEAALAQSRNFLDKIINTAPNPIFVKDRQHRGVLVNDAFCHLMGLKREDLLNKSDHDHDCLTRAQADEFRSRDELVFKTGREDINEETITAADGALHHIITKKALYTDEQDERFIVGVITDITERKQAEESKARLATAVEQAAESIVITNIRGAILYVNPAFEKASGYTRAEVLGRNPCLLKSGKQDAEFYRRMWEVLKRGEIWSGHFINRRKDGTFYEEEATISPVRDATGTIVNYVAVKRDVTRERQLEAQFQQAQKMEAIGQLAGGVAHDFNNMLGVIIGYSEMIAADLDPDSPLHACADEILRAAERATALTRQLLVFSRKQKVEPVVLNLNGTVKDLDKMLRRLIGENIEMTVTPGKDIGHILADPGHIGQVLMNLAINARDAMPNGGKLAIATSRVALDEARLRARNNAVPGDCVVLSVSDTGTGMTPEVQARLFEPLFTTKPAGKGTGLGLATCQTIVQQSGGWIDVESEPGRGTTFRIYFPQVDRPLAAATRQTPTKLLPRGTETLLLAEDEPSVRHLAASVLETLGYKVLRANNGQDALRLVRELNEPPIHLVVTDVVMPKMGGKVMTDWLKTSYPDIKIIYTSGYTDEAIVREGVLQPGAVFLPKPYKPDVLARKVRAVLDGVTETARP
ncbi:MAG TPA: PAS domain S-box protein [Verrucomicrobiae bacterium]|nr:PAS domain S-box protein [Verrucomicrobiae bacterium]